MAEKRKSVNVPKFTIERPKGQKTPVCKISVPTIHVDDLETTIGGLLKQARADARFGKSIRACRGTITLYS